MDPNSKSKKQQNTRRPSFLESLKEVGTETPKDFMRELFGTQMPSTKHFSGEIQPLEQVHIDEVLSGEREQREKVEQQISLERNLRAEEEALRSKKIKELQLSIHALMQELAAATQASSKLATEIEIAAFQAPVNPGIYHVIFLEKLIEYIHGFRKRIEDAAVWLHAANKRANKKTFWGQYKMHGGRRLLSAEDYSGRSAA